ncbi:DUF494 family protein [Rhodoferax sp.]|uniref:DUF494 family protein n=1 Tax=Rhodoferax sp. TaxID=50421 RepID=UPI0026386BF3|nr:DUF494 domain-containing protein [Rhodoferax sp.]MDD2926037.1 DUF494 domain-containing protein [Rhodoferax sp.]
MFEVLAYVYDNYWDGEACPALPTLQRTLGTVGFAPQEITTALIWLEELKSAAGVLRTRHRDTTPATALTTASVIPMTRVLTTSEHGRVGVAGWGFLAFLVSIGTLSRERLELVMERAMAAPGDPLSVDDLKLIVLMVFWSLGQEPDALVLDELCDHRTDRLAH